MPAFSFSRGVARIRKSLTTIAGLPISKAPWLGGLDPDCKPHLQPQQMFFLLQLILTRADRCQSSKKQASSRRMIHGPLNGQVRTCQKLIDAIWFCRDSHDDNECSDDVVKRVRAIQTVASNVGVLHYTRFQRLPTTQRSWKWWGRRRQVTSCREQYACCIREQQ